VIVHRDLNHCVCDEVLKTVTSTTYGQLEKWWYCMQWRKTEWIPLHMEYYLFTVVYLCLATNGVHQQIHLLAIA